MAKDILGEHVVGLLEIVAWVGVWFYAEVRFDRVVGPSCRGVSAVCIDRVSEHLRGWADAQNFVNYFQRPGFRALTYEVAVCKEETLEDFSPPPPPVICAECYTHANDCLECRERAVANWSCEYPCSHSWL